MHGEHWREREHRMRLLLLGGTGGTHVAASLLRAADTLGHQAQLLDHAVAYAGPKIWRLINWHLRQRRPARRRVFSESVQARMQAFRPQLLIATGCAPLEPKLLAHARSQGVVTSVFLTDDPYNTGLCGPWFFPVLHGFDHAFTPRTANLTQLRDLGGPVVHYLPFGYDDFLFKGKAIGAKAEPEFDLVFVGGGDPDRFQVLSHIADSGLKLGLFGGYWERDKRLSRFAKGYLTPAQLCELPDRSAVSLILVRRANRDGHVMRSLEAAALGSCLLVEHTAEHEAIFGADGACVRYFQHPSQIASITRELLATPDARLRLRLAVAALIEKNGHRYQDRLAQIVSLSALARPNTP